MRRTLRKEKRLVNRDGFDGDQPSPLLFSDLWSTMGHCTNFTTIWNKNNFTSYGGRSPSGEWKGMMGEIVSGRTDVAVGEMTITRERQDSIDFVGTVYSNYIKGFIRRRKVKRLRWTDFLSPFDASLWSAAVGVALSLTLALTVSLRARRRLIVPPRDAWLFVVAAFCQQGQRVPRAWSGRVVCVCAHIVALVLASAHSGALISSLSAGHNRPLYSSLREALDDANARFLITRHSGITDLVRDSRFVDLLNLSHRLEDSFKKNITPPHGLQLFEKVCSGDKYIGFFGVLDKLILTPLLSCEVDDLPNFRLYNPLSIGIKKGTGFTDYLSYYVRRMRRVGVVKRLVHRYWPKSSQPSTQRPKPEVRLEGVAPLFLVLAVGAVLALMLLVLERSFPPSTDNANGMPYSQLSYM